MQKLTLVTSYFSYYFNIKTLMSKYNFKILCIMYKRSENKIRQKVKDEHNYKSYNENFINFKLYFAQ